MPPPPSGQPDRFFTVFFYDFPYIIIREALLQITQKQNPILITNLFFDGLSGQVKFASDLDSPVFQEDFPIWTRLNLRSRSYSLIARA